MSLGEIRLGAEGSGPQRKKTDGTHEGDADGISRRTLLGGGGAAVLGWFLFVRDDEDETPPQRSSSASSSGYDDPEVAVETFVTAVQAGNTDKASSILYQEEHERPMDLLGSAYETFSEDDIHVASISTRNEETERVEIELLYTNDDHGDPTYRFGALFYLRETDGGWRIYEFDGTHIGGPSG